MKLRGQAWLQTRHASQTLASSSHHFILKILFHSISHSEISSQPLHRIQNVFSQAAHTRFDCKNIERTICLLNPLFTYSLSTGDRVIKFYRVMDMLLFKLTASLSIKPGLCGPGSGCACVRVVAVRSIKCGPRTTISFHNLQPTVITSLLSAAHSKNLQKLSC